MRRKLGVAAIAMLVGMAKHLPSQCGYNCYCEEWQSAPYSGSCLGAATTCVSWTQYCYCADGIGFSYDVFCASAGGSTLCSESGSSCS